MRYLVFIGRWSPLHRGHKAIIRSIHDEKQLPVLIMVRETEELVYSLEQRVNIIENWLKAEHIPGKVMIIPDIEGVYYGRGVGYEVREVVVDEATKRVSGTGVREAQSDLKKVYDSVMESDETDDEAFMKERLRKLGYIE